MRTLSARPAASASGWQHIVVGTRVAHIVPASEVEGTSMLLATAAGPDSAGTFTVRQRAVRAVLP